MSLEHRLCSVRHYLGRSRNISPFGAVSRVGPSSGELWVAGADHHRRAAAEEAVLALVGVLAENHEHKGLVGSVRHDLEDNDGPAR